MHVMRTRADGRMGGEAGEEKEDNRKRGYNWERGDIWENKLSELKKDLRGIYIFMY